MITACIMSFIAGALIMLCAIGVVSNCKEEESRNKVRFYVARDKNDRLFLYIGKPIRCNTYFISINSVFMFPCHTFHYFGLNENDFDNLKWEDEPVEVFINMKN